MNPYQTAGVGRPTLDATARTLGMEKSCSPDEPSVSLRLDRLRERLEEARRLTADLHTTLVPPRPCVAGPAQAGVDVMGDRVEFLERMAGGLCDDLLAVRTALIG